MYPWFVILILIILIIANVLPYLIYKITLWFRSKGLIDIGLYNLTEATVIKPVEKKNKNKEKPVFYRALEYGMYDYRKNTRLFEI